jgi:hypothetical protein
MLVAEQGMTSGGSVRFGRRQSKGVLLGFSALRLAAIGSAVAVFVPSMFLAGSVGVVVASPVWLSLLGSGFVTWSGQPVVEALPTAAHFGVRRLTGQTGYRVRPDDSRPAGTLALPGDAAALRFHADAVSGAVMVHDPHGRTLTAVARVSHPAFVLLAPEEQSRRVAGWGRVLAGLSASGTCARLQVLELALPDQGRGITGWWAEHGSTDTTTWPVREYATLLAEHAPSASTHQTLIALALDLKAAAPAVRDAGRGMVGAAAVLRQDMTALESSLRAAELSRTHWLDEAALAGIIRAAYDPVTAARIDGTGLGLDLSTAGPVGVEEHWGYLRHDTGYSAVLWISEWPRIEVPAQFLHGLIFQPGVRKTLSVTATPLPATQAMRELRRQKVEYVTDAHHKQRLGVLADESDAQEYRDVLDRERALIAGHADLKFTGLLTVTAVSKDALDAAVSQIQRAATQSGCETRLLHGQQARAFTVAALPLARRVH